MDDFNLRDMLAPPLRMQSDLQARPIDHKSVEPTENWRLAMAYVPMQQWNSAYMPAEALIHGTLFPDLNLPFEGGSRP